MLCVCTLIIIIEKSFKSNTKAWRSLIKLVNKQSRVLGDLLQELSNLYADATIPKAHKKATLDVWLPLLKVLASFNSVCPLIPFAQVCCTAHYASHTAPHCLVHQTSTK